LAKGDLRMTSVLERTSRIKGFARGTLRPTGLLAVQGAGHVETEGSARGQKRGDSDDQE
jgi:hypothetical protein